MLKEEIKKVIEDLGEKNDSFYLYDEKKILDSVTTLKENFQEINFLYSLKTNANPYIVKSIIDKGLGIDAASLNEVLLGENQGLKKDEIYYSAPGKSRKDIEGAVDKSIIIADSLNEIYLINKIGREKEKKIQIGVRINPNFSFEDQKGHSSKFGIDEDIFIEKINSLVKLENIEIIGFHIHIKSQELNKENLVKYYEKLMRLIRKIQNLLDYDISFLNMGSGLGIAYDDKDKDIDIKDLGLKVQTLVKTLKKEFKNLKVYIESGRFIVGKSGLYITSVMDKKTSHGKIYIILKNTLNGFIRPSLTQLISLYSKGETFGTEPLFTKRTAFQFLTLIDREKEKVDLMGNLCTSADIVAKDIELPRLEIGDFLIMTNAGAYARVLSPIQFSSQEEPCEFYLKINGEVIEISK